MTISIAVTGKSGNGKTVITKSLLYNLRLKYPEKSFLIVDNEMILCLYDYRESSGGNLYQVDDDLNEKKIASDVFGYYLKQNGEIAIKKNEKNGKFDLYETYDGEVVEIKKGAEKILFY